MRLKNMRHIFYNIDLFYFYFQVGSFSRVLVLVSISMQ
jgi:hypothetical protein